MIRLIKISEKIIVGISIFVAMISLFSTIVLGFMQIILRNFYDSGIGWADVIIRNLVLWIGLSGAVIATYKGRHIAIGVLIRTVPGSIRRFSHIIISLISSVISGFVAWASVRFVISEKEMGSTVAGNFPLWVLELIIPISFIFMSYLFLLKIFERPVPYEEEPL